MKTHSNARTGVAFTLIELLVVIAVMGLLAGLLLPVMGAVKRNAVKTRARAELRAVVLAIESYKTKLGHYPPDNSGATLSPYVSQLYFELLGTRLVNNGTRYETLDGSAWVDNMESAFRNAFGQRPNGRPAVTGFINCTRSANADDAPAAKAFITDLKPTQYGPIDLANPDLKVLLSSVGWPVDHAFQPLPGNKGRNPWRYVSANPTNNPGRFDLWLDVLIGGKTNRISNWSDQPQIVNTL